MVRAIFLCLIASLALAGRAACQRPKTAEQALARFEAVKDKVEGDRRRAASDLGDFADTACTAALLAELARAEGQGYRQAIVKALGQCPRPQPPGVVAALRSALDGAENPRFADAAAEALAGQGDVGVKDLGEVLAAATGGIHRNAACSALGKHRGDLARDLLIAAVGRASGRLRMAPLEALAGFGSDTAVDALRVELAADGDFVVAAEAVGQLAASGHAGAAGFGLQLARRLPAQATGEQHAAVLQALLVAPTAETFEPTLVAAARAEAAFGKRFAAGWTTALQDAAFLQFLLQQGPARKLPDERRAAAMALASAPIAERARCAPALTRLCGDRDPDVVRAAAATLALCGADVARSPLEKLFQSPRDGDRIAAGAALVELCAEEPLFHARLFDLARDKSPTARALALQLLAACPAADAASVLAAAKDGLLQKAWQVRGAAIDLLVARRDKDGIPLLFDALDGSDGRVHEDLLQGLAELTGGLRFGTTAEWRTFWAKEGAGFQVPAKKEPEKDSKRGRDREAPAATVASYWNIPVRSDRVAFVVDVSGSMNQPFGTGGGTRLDESKRQLERVLAMLPPKAKVNLVAFSTKIDSLASKLVPLDGKQKKAAEAFVAALEARLATDVCGGLERAFADPEVDTIFLLTDGQPSAGRIVEPQALAKEVRAWNLGRGVRIHTIALGGDSKFLEQLAAESGGQHAVAR